MAGVQMTIDSAVIHQAATITIGSTTSTEFIEYTYSGERAGLHLPDDPNIGSGEDTLTIRASSDHLSQCDLPYETIVVPLITAGDRPCGDDLCIPVSKKPDARWHRIVGADNEQRQLSAHVCGRHAGHLAWLSGVALDHPNWILYNDLSVELPAGTIPSQAEGIVQRVMCLEDCAPNRGHALKISIVNCGEFVLWQLPSIAAGLVGYCLE